MTGYNYIDDARLPPNALAVADGAGNARYALEWGTDDDGERGVSVTEFDPDHDDESVSGVQYVFAYRKGIYVQKLATVHRHGDDGHHSDGCEQVPATEEPATDDARNIVADYFDAPVAGPNGNETTAEGSDDE